MFYAGRLGFFESIIILLILVTSPLWFSAIKLWDWISGASRREQQEREAREKARRE